MSKSVCKQILNIGSNLIVNPMLSLIISLLEWSPPWTKHTNQLVPSLWISMCRGFRIAGFEQKNILNLSHHWPSTLCCICSFRQRLYHDLVQPRNSFQTLDMVEGQIYHHWWKELMRTSIAIETTTKSSIDSLIQS